MNAERLHQILIEVYNEMEEYELDSKFTALKTHLQNLVSQPQQPSHQENLSTTLNELYSSLQKYPSNNFSPVWKQIIEEIGGTELLGLNLKHELESIFSSNQITPSNALDDISGISEKIDNFRTSISDIITGFSSLDIGSEELEPGECEIGYSIPRGFIENKLGSLNREISDLNFILNNISEVVTDEKIEFEVRTISSSDFLFYLGTGLVMANVLSKILERIINNYKTILEIKDLRNKLKSKGVPTKSTEGIENYANSLMDKEILKLSKEIIKEYYNGNDVGRKNELSNGLIISMNKIANRIDKGFNMEIRVEPLPEPDEDEEISEELKNKINLVSNIQKSSETIEFFNTKGKSILQLKESDDS